MILYINVATPAPVTPNLGNTNNPLIKTISPKMLNIFANDSIYNVLFASHTDLDKNANILLKDENINPIIIAI